MSVAPAFTLRCPAFDLAALAALAGAGFLVGLPDPLAGLTAEERDARLADSVRRLQEEGHVARDGAGRLRPAPRLQLLLDSLVRASSCLTAGLAGIRQGFLAYYSGGPLLLRIAVDPVHGCLATLDAEGPEEALVKLDFPQPAPAEPRSFDLPPQALGRLRAEGTPERVAAEIARITGRPASPSLARALLRPRRAGGVTVLRRFSEAGWVGEGLNFLEGEEGLWRLRTVRRGQEDWTEVAEVGGAALTEDLLALARQFAPVGPRR